MLGNGTGDYCSDYSDLTSARSPRVVDWRDKNPCKEVRNARQHKSEGRGFESRRQQNTFFGEISHGHICLCEKCVPKVK